MEVKRMYQEGVSISELSRRTGHDRKTIRKVVQEQEDGKKPLAGTKRKGSKLEPYKPYVEQRMRFWVLNAERILREIREQGYTGGITVLREFMHPLRPIVSAKATVRFETGPGEQAQIDLGAFPYIDTEGNQRTLWCFAMVLSYSRMLYLEFIKASDQLHILQALRNCQRRVKIGSFALLVELRVREYGGLQNLPPCGQVGYIASWSRRALNNAKLALPYICLFRFFSRLT